MIEETLIPTPRFVAQRVALVVTAIVVALGINAIWPVKSAAAQPSPPVERYSVALWQGSGVAAAQPRPDCSTLVIAEQWRCLYSEQTRDFAWATRDGFASPGYAHNIGSDVIVVDAGSGDILPDWSHPVGFALVDCDRKVTMLDGRSAAVVSWDAKAHCLRVRVGERP